MKTPCNEPDRATTPGTILRLAERAFSCLMICGLLFGLPGISWAQRDNEAEYGVKLAFLYNFAQFIQWPPDAFHDATSPLNLCVAGPNPFEGDIEQSLRGHTAGGHPIVIKQLGSNDDPRVCHMIFVRAGEKKLAEKLFAKVKGLSTLTVGENKGFADLGGDINLTLEDNKLRFEINLEAATRTRLKISSKLLALAKIVKVQGAP